MNGEYEPYHENTIFPKCGLKGLKFFSNTLEIANKNEIFAIGVSMQRKYADAFVNTGTIKFGCPKKWIDEASSSDPGRADIQEGVFAAYSPNDHEGILKGVEENPGSYPIRLVSSHSDLVYLVDSNVIVLPTYCFYVIRCGDFKIYKSGKEYKAYCHIPFRYFRGLANGKSWQQAQSDDPNDRYVFIIVYDDNSFISRIKNALFKHGVNEEEILYRQIDYTNIDVPFAKQVEHPFELFRKNQQFDDQHEGRIVLNLPDTALREYFINNTIDIGPLNDICVFDDFYHGGGMTIFIDLEFDE